MNLKSKVFAVFFAFSFLPFLIFAIFSLYQTKNSLQHQVKKEIKTRNEIIKKSIYSEVEKLRALLSTWSKQQIMNDIIVDDVDKRIASFLRKAQKVLNFKGYIVCTDPEGYVVASSVPEIEGIKLKVRSDFIVLKTSVFSSFGRREKIGELYIIYSLENFKKFLKGSYAELLKGKAETGFSEKGEFITYTSEFEKEPLKGYYLVTGEKKEVIFSSVYRTLSFFSLISLFSLFFTFIGFSFFTFRIFKPLENLTITIRDITRSGDYSKRVSVKSKDEVGELSRAFNELLNKVENLLSELEEESRLRFRLFVKLVEMIQKTLKEENEERLFSYTLREVEELLGKRVRFTKEKCGFEVRAKVIRGEELKEETLGYICPEGELSPEAERFLISVCNLLSAQVERVNLLKLEKTLRKKAEESSRAKSAFLGSISHELKTPLHAIIGFSEYLSEVLEGELREASESINRSGKYLLSLINEILDFVKAEAGAFKVKSAKVNVEELVEEVMKLVEHAAREKGLELRKNVKVEDICTDPIVLKKILLNFLSNAVKFTEKGYVELGVIKKGNVVEFYVKDTGIGIEKEKQREIFEPFTQTEEGMRRGGTGLGLALCKKLADLIGGSVGVYSEGKGKGSLFFLKIPRDLLECKS
ncbi:MAG: hypothetical protein DSY32_02815 [Aquifex sp.]|nr:MAG: hypothetical protein DSY32_02815 [Aquifex sp.]